MAPTSNRLEVWLDRDGCTSEVRDRAACLLAPGGPWLTNTPCSLLAWAASSHLVVIALSPWGFLPTRRN